MIGNHVTNSMGTILNLHVQGKGFLVGVKTFFGSVSSSPDEITIGLDILSRFLENLDVWLEKGMLPRPLTPKVYAHSRTHHVHLLLNVIMRVRKAAESHETF